MTAFALLGGWTVGRNVVETMGGCIVPSGVFSMEVSIVGLGWGRATRSVTLTDTAQGEMGQTERAGGLAADTDTSPTVGHPETEPSGDAVEPIGVEPDEEQHSTGDLFDPETTARIILLQHLVPVIATVAAVVVFRLTGLA